MLAQILATTAALTAAVALSAQGNTHPDELKLRGDIDAAIAMGVDNLFEEQHRDGSWGLHGDYIGGRASLALYTLLQCGVSRDHPAVRRAIAHIDAVEPDRTYSTACMILALDALRDGREERIAKLVEKLAGWQKPRGDWAYPHSTPDLSCTQFAALGLWIGHKRGIDIDPSHWLKLVDALDAYREEPIAIDNPREDGRTGASKLDMAGYSYRDRSDKQAKSTGSMTAAGIAVLAICKAGLGRKLRRDMRRQIDDRLEAATLWLAQNFDAERSPNGGPYHYYLYGLERVGALLQTEQLGEHWWYVEGAKQLLAKQRDGSWGNVTDTCFALLFLRRATSGTAPTTGLSSAERHIFAAADPDADADIRLRGAGQHPLALWIDGFGESLRDLHEDYGLRVVSVEYLDEQENVLAKVAGDPTKVSQTETYLHREKAMPRGKHMVRARVTLLANDVEPGQTEPVAVIESNWMDVRIRDVLEPWMEEVSGSFQKSLLQEQRVEVVTTSNLDDRNAGKNLIDGSDSTRWIASPDDEQPGATITWRKPMRVGSILFTLLARHEREFAQFDGIGGVEVRFGNDRDRWTRIPVGDDPLAPIEFVLPKSRKLRSIELRFVDRERRKGQVGLSEFVLLPPGK